MCIRQFLSTSRVHNSTNNNSIIVPWPLCTCSVYIVTMVQVPNHYLENCRRSCGDWNISMKCNGRTHKHIDTRTDGRTYDGGQNYMPSSTSWRGMKKQITDGKQSWQVATLLPKLNPFSRGAPHTTTTPRSILKDVDLTKTYRCGIPLV